MVNDFVVLVYINDDLVIVKCLEDFGCVVVMLVGVLIGIGLGIFNLYNIELIVDWVNVFVILDVGIGMVLEVILVMELGCDVVFLVFVVICVYNLVGMV